MYVSQGEMSIYVGGYGYGRVAMPDSWYKLSIVFPRR